MFKKYYKKIKDYFNFRMDFSISYSGGWVFLLLIFVILNIIIATFSFHLYYQIDEGRVFVSEAQSGEVMRFDKIRKNELLKTIDVFDKKNDNLEFLKKEGLPLNIDPSL